MEWALMPLKRYADFSGRSRRKEYWMFQLLIIVVLVLLITVGIAIAAMTGAGGEPSAAFWLVLGVAGLMWLGIIIPTIAVQVRRFHDQNHSGWMFLLNFIPYVGGLVVIVFMCIEGTNGDNRYGPDPKAGEPGHDTHAHLAERFS